MSERELFHARLATWSTDSPFISSTADCYSLTLDLSFNNISEVGEGLKQLTKLRDLGLAHNQLTDIAGFDSLSQLQSLSLASNKLTHLNQVSREPSL